MGLRVAFPTMNRPFIPQSHSFFCLWFSNFFKMSHWHACGMVRASAVTWHNQIPPYGRLAELACTGAPSACLQEYLGEHLNSSIWWHQHTKKLQLKVLHTECRSHALSYPSSWQSTKTLSGFKLIFSFGFEPIWDRLLRNFCNSTRNH